MVNRVADKESAKSILKHNGNQAAMIGSCYSDPDEHEQELCNYEQYGVGHW